MEKKKVLFVINTLGRAGAETALMELLRNLDPEKLEISLMVLLGQGEMVHEVPKYVKVCNHRYDDSPVLGKAGRKKLAINLFRQLFAHGAIFKNIPYLIGRLWDMLQAKKFQMDKLLWHVMADGAQRLDEEYDLAIAYLEGGSAYYVDRYVKAKKKAGFVHIDYNMAGYNRKMDHSCYLRYDQIFTVSSEVKEAFLVTYPECKDKVSVFPNLLNRTMILEKAAMAGGFSDDYDGFRILTVGRLTAQKAMEVSIDAMKLIKDQGKKVRWYVLGDGDQRRFLEKRIVAQGLEEDFLLLGAVENPYPYFQQCDLYVHASRYEGKSIAIQESLILGCAVVVTDCSGNREQVTNGVNGVLCEFRSDVLSQEIIKLMESEDTRRLYGKNAALKYASCDKDVKKIYELL